GPRCPGGGDSAPGRAQPDSHDRTGLPAPDRARPDPGHRGHGPDLRLLDLVWTGGQIVTRQKIILQLTHGHAELSALRKRLRSAPSGMPVRRLSYLSDIPAAFSDMILR